MVDLDPFGITPGAAGLAGNPEMFLDLAQKAKVTFGLNLPQVIHNYHLVVLLYHMSQIPGSEIVVNNRAETASFQVVLIGGTSLSAAWEISDRFSVDVDIEEMTDNPESLSNSAIINALKAMAKAINLQQLEALPGSGFNKERMYLKHEYLIGHDRKAGIALKLEAFIREHDPTIVAPCPVRSYMGRVADSDMLARYPELGGFELLCQTPDATAVAKLDAIHRRAVHHLYEELVERVRDIYDTASIAKTPWGKLSNERIIHLSERAINGPAIVPSAPRPPGGYVNSPAFDPNTDAYAALKRGYLDLPETLGIVNLPDFEEAVELTRSIDLGPN